MQLGHVESQIQTRISHLTTSLHHSSGLFLIMFSSHLSPCFSLLFLMLTLLNIFFFVKLCHRWRHKSASLIRGLSFQDEIRSGFEEMTENKSSQGRNLPLFWQETPLPSRRFSWLTQTHTHTSWKTQTHRGKLPGKLGAILGPHHLTQSQWKRGSEGWREGAEAWTCCPWWNKPVEFNFPPVKRCQ